LVAQFIQNYNNYLREERMTLVRETHSPQTKSSFDLSVYLAERGAAVEAALDSALPVTYPEKIYEAMRYSLLAGGKRLRPILCLATCELVGGNVEMAMPTACALDHKVYGDDIAILAGDGLLAFAFEIVAARTQNVPPQQVLQVIARLGKAVGAAGLVGGQVVDLDSEGVADVSEETLTFIHTHKTGALLEACVVCGAILAGATTDDLDRLSRYAQNIGLAFQIVDDILDITATQEQLGKTAGKDLQAQKVTYPSLWGIEESKRRAQALVESAQAELAIFGEKAQPLLAIADFITNRTH
jgi:geranylgeranyl diphosphate synthase type II